MTKVTLPTIASGYNLTAINEAFALIEDELNNKVLYRDNPTGEPNAMDDVLDMNGKQIINLPAPSTLNSAARLRDVQNAISGITPASLIPFTPTPNISSGTVQAAIEEVYDAIETVEPLPPQTGNAGKFLRTDGASPSWQSITENAGTAKNFFDFLTSAQIADVQAGTRAIDLTSAFNSAIAVSRNLFFPAGVYRFSTLSLANVRGLILQGAGASLAAGGVRYTSNTVFSFDEAVLGTDGFVVTDFIGLAIKDIVFSMRRGTGPTGSGGGRTIYLSGGHDYILQNIKVDTRVGGGGAGIILGGGNGTTATFIGTLQNIKVFSHTSVAIKLNFGTSIKMMSCYQVGGWFEYFGMTYCTIDNCASELAPNFYGYIVDGCTNMVFAACAGEGNARGVFYLNNGSKNINIDSPYGAANNTSGDTGVGDLVHMDSSSLPVRNVFITTPTSVATNPATVQSIFGGPNTGYTVVEGVDIELLPKGIGGNGTWIATQLTRTGFEEVQSWTPVLNSWTNSGTPTRVGGYVKKGKVVNFYVKITPGTNISATRPSSTITGLPFTNILAGTGAMTDGNTVSYGAVAVGNTGIIYPQTTGVLTVEVAIIGTLILA